MTPASHSELAVGIDIGTTSVKAVAADAEGNVVARARVPHKIVIPEAEKFEHDADEAWRSNRSAAGMTILCGTRLRATTLPSASAATALTEVVPISMPTANSPCDAGVIVPSL